MPFENDCYSSWEDVQVLILENSKRESEKRLARLKRNLLELIEEIKEQEAAIERTSETIKILRKKYRISVRA